MKKILLLLAIAFNLYAAETFHEDFEGTGGDSTWTTSPGLIHSTSTFDRDASHPSVLSVGGSQCCHIQGATSGTVYGWGAGKTTTYTKYTLGYFHIDSVAPSADVLFYRWASTSGSSTVLVYARQMADNNLLRVWCSYRNNGAYSTSTYDTVAKRSFFKINIKYDSVNTTGGFVFRINDTTTQTANLTGALRGIKYVQIGNDSLTNASTHYYGNIYCDNIIADDADWPTISTESFADGSGSSGIVFNSKNKAYMDYYYNPFAISSITVGSSLDYHTCMGVRRSVRLGETVLQLAEFTSPAAGTERTFRSVENGDNGTWVAIDSNATKSGCLVIDQQDTVYHFYLKYPYDTLCMVKYYIGATSIPAPTKIDTLALSDWDYNATYCYTTATINSKNELFLVASDGPGDTLFCYKSTDRGTTWTKSRVSTVPGRIFPNIECGYDDTLHIVTTDRRGYGSNTMVSVYAKSGDGANWAVTSLTAENTMAHVLLPDRNDTIYMFAQGTPSGAAWGGVIKKVSSDNGQSWSSWSLVAPTGTSTGNRYGDPSAALDNNRNIYLAYRTDSITTLDGDWHEQLLKSADHGATWSILDNWIVQDNRTGTKSSMRYQTWYNNGGPVEWSWIQANVNETDKPTYYDRYDYATLSDIPDTSSINYTYASGSSGIVFGAYGTISADADATGVSGIVFGSYGDATAIADGSGSSGILFGAYGSGEAVNPPPVITVDPVDDTTTTQIRMFAEYSGYQVQTAWYKFHGTDTVLVGRDSLLTYTVNSAMHNDSFALVAWNDADTVMSAKAKVYVVYAVFDSVNTTDSNRIYIHGNFLSGSGWTATLSDSTLTTESGSATAQVFGYNHKIALNTNRYKLIIANGDYTVTLWIGRKKSTGNNKLGLNMVF